jgi:hypothetical protein
LGWDKVIERQAMHGTLMQWVINKILKYIEHGCVTKVSLTLAKGCLIVFFFFFLWYWGLNSGPHSC